MSLTKREKDELQKLRKKSKGTPLKVTLRRGTANVKISGGGFKPVYRQLGGNVGLTASTVFDARKRVIAKRKKEEKTMAKKNVTQLHRFWVNWIGDTKKT